MSSVEFREQTRVNIACCIVGAVLLAFGFIACLYFILTIPSTFHKVFFACGAILTNYLMIAAIFEAVSEYRKLGR